MSAHLSQLTALPVELQTIIQQIQQPYQDIRDLPHRVHLCQQVLKSLSRAGNEELWAGIQVELGNALTQNQLGDQAENIEQAIAAYQQALSVRTKATTPINWAITIGNMGNAYGYRIYGDRAENIEQAIAAYQQALTIIKQTTIPTHWAQIMTNMGNAYGYRIYGDRAENIEQAIAAYQQALTVRKQSTMPDEWAQSINGLGNAYADRIRGDRAENIEQAITAYQQALSVFTQTTSPISWAQTMKNLASVYIERMRGDQSDNIEQAIIIYQQVLTVLTQTTLPLDWAETMNNLGIAYSDRIRGDRAENVEQAIAAYQQAFTVYTQTTSPIDWARTMNNLGLAYINRIRGDRAENVEQAIAAYQQAFTVYTQTTLPIDWARTMNIMGNAYIARIREDQAENIEQAIAAYQQAFTVFTQTTLPIDWARTMNNLGLAYINRIRGDREENIEQAIAAYQQALSVFTQTTLPDDWARTMINLGLAYTIRIRGDREENIEQAIAAYQQALSVKTRTAMPLDWAETMNKLALAYINRIRGDRAENIEQAIAAYQQVLTVYTQTTLPIDWADTMGYLGVAYADRIHGDMAENVEQAIAAYQQALTIMTRLELPLDHRHTLINLLDVYFSEKRWGEAYQTCIDAIAVSTDIFIAAYSDTGRIDSIKRSEQLYIRAAYSALQLERYGDALKHLEANRARLLAEAQSLGNSKLMLLDSDEHKQLQNLRDQTRGLEYEYRLSTENPSRRNDQVINKDLRKLRTALRGLIDVLRAKYADFMPEGLSLDELLRLIPVDGALVAPLFTTQGSAIFIVPSGTTEVTAAHVLMLDNFKLDDLKAISRGEKGNLGWLSYYTDYRFKGGGASRLLDGIEDVTRRLWDTLVGRMHERLQALSVRGVLLMPQGDTNLLPLHASWREIDGARHYFMDDYVITYVPSMATLANAKNKSSMGAGALVIGVSKYKKMGELSNALTEAEGIAALFGIEALLDASATIDAVRDGVPGKAYIHLACHGSFGWGKDPFASALYLGNDEALLLPEIMAKLNLDSARLVVLSACETGIVDFNNVPDEFVGLPASFMQAGAAAVISSLWTVEDRSTALLMERMYKQILDKENPLEPAQALREAQSWLREVTAKEIGDYYQSYLIPRMSQSEAETAFFKVMMRSKPDERPYSHPFYWAAFTYSGI